jgi:hypothetical protein
MPIPIIIIGVAAVAAVAAAGCTFDIKALPASKDTGPLPDDAGAGDRPPAPDGTSGDGQVGPPPDGPMSQDAQPAGDAEVPSDGGPVTPFAPGTARVGAAPCAFPASLSTNAAGDRLLLTCGGTTNALFRSPLLSGSGNWTSADWTRIAIVVGYPSHHALLTDRYAVVNHSGPDGFTIVDLQNDSTTDNLLLTPTLRDPQGQLVSFTPNNPAGAVLAGGLLCVATSNLNHVDTDPALTTFHPGTFVCAPWNGDGTVNNAAAVVYPTSGINPTGMAAIDTDRFAVLSSGPYAPGATNPAKLDICTAPAMSCVSTDLGAITAQISPSLALSAGGLLLFGAQKPTNKLMGVDPDSHAITVNREMPAVTNFIASVATSGDVAALSDFGVFGQGGAVLYANVDPAGWTGVPVTPLTGSAGPSTISGTKLYQSVTANDGASGSVWKIEMSGMQ